MLILQPTFPPPKPKNTLWVRLIINQKQRKMSSSDREKRKEQRRKELEEKKRRLKQLKDKKNDIAKVCLPPPQSKTKMLINRDFVSSHQSAHSKLLLLLLRLALHADRTHSLTQPQELGAGGIDFGSISNVQDLLKTLEETSVVTKIATDTDEVR